MRYEFTPLGDTGAVKYKYGYTEIHCNGSSGKTIIKNPTSDSHIEYQFDEVFGLGEFKKLSKHIVSHSKEKHPLNPHCVEHIIIADYIPKVARKDLQNESLPGIGKEDLIGKYFKR